MALLYLASLGAVRSPQALFLVAVAIGRRAITVEVSFGQLDYFNKLSFFNLLTVTPCCLAIVLISVIHMVYLRSAVQYHA